MKKSNSILQAAVVGALLVMSAGAQATTVATSAPVFASELFKGTTPNATAISLASTAIVSNVSIPPNSIVTVYVKLNGATFTALPTVPSVGTTIVVSGIALGSTSSATLVAGTNSDVAFFQVNTDSVTTIGVGGTLATLTASTVNNAAANLGAATSVPVTAIASVNVGAPAFVNGAAVPTVGVFDSASTATTVASSAIGITSSVAASSAFPFNAGGVAETAKIDLAATPAGAAFTGAANGTGTTKLNLGAFRFTNNAVAKIANGTTAYTITGQVAATGLTGTVAAPAGFFAALGTTGTLTFNTAADCTGAIAGALSTTFGTLAAAAAATSVSVATTAVPASATNHYVCMNLPTITAASVALVPGTPTFAATLAHILLTTDSNESIAATPMFPLQLNGSQVDVRSYIPAAAVGYQSFVRVINTGAQAAPVTGQFVNIDGTSGTAGTIIASLPAGGSVTLTATQIEAALGAPAGGAEVRPRLRVTAPTVGSPNGLNVQSFMSSPAGVFTDMTGAQ